MNERINKRGRKPSGQLTSVVFLGPQVRRCELDCQEDEIELPRRTSFGENVRQMRSHRWQRHPKFVGDLSRRAAAEQTPKRPNFCWRQIERRGNSFYANIRTLLPNKGA